MRCCSQTESPVCGGKTEHVEEKAPIKSTELKSLSVNMFISPRSYSLIKFNDFYTIKLTPEAGGKFKLSCNDNSVMIGNDEVKGLQDIIKTYELEAKNGLYSVTAGLPPEHQPLNFKAVYASGEELKFTVNNSPYAEWEIMLFRYVRDVFVAHGDKNYIVDDDKEKLGSFSFEFSDGDGLWYSYCVALDENDDKNLMKMVYDKKTDECVEEVLIPVPKDYIENMNALIDKIGLAWIANEMRFKNKPDVTKQCYYEFKAMNADDQHLFFTAYRKENMTDNVKSVLSQIREYIEKPFKQKK